MSSTVKFKEVVAISGMGGLYQNMRQRPDGMIVRALGDTKTRFVSNRIHTFSILDTLSIFTNTDNDSMPLIDVMLKMKEDDLEGGSVPSHKGTSKVLKAYMKRVIPDYSESRVYVSDIKKLVKWYHILKEFDLIHPEEAEQEAEEQEPVESTEE